MLTEKDYCDYDTCVALKELGYEAAEYRGYYVTKCGKVFTKKGKEVKMHINKNGYWAFGIHENGKTTSVRLHRALAICFIPNPNNLPMINHKDGCKTNNSLDNLEWVTAQENVQHAWDNGLNNATQERVVICLETGKVYKSARFASDTLGYGSPSAITACCKGKRKTAYKGCHWRYYQPEEYVKDLIELGFDKYPKDNSEDELTCYLALAQKWLREEKRICVEVDCCTGGYVWELCKAYHKDWFSGGTTIYTHCCEDNAINPLLNDCGKYDSYEEALLEGIKQAIKILKEKNNGN